MSRDRVQSMVTAVRVVLRLYTATSAQTVLCECRHCRTKLETGTPVCPVCDATEIARYDLADIS